MQIDALIFNYNIAISVQLCEGKVHLGGNARTQLNLERLGKFFTYQKYIQIILTREIPRPYFGRKIVAF